MSKFTKQHYELIADILGEAIHHMEESTMKVRRVMYRMADTLAHDNERFEKEKFVQRANGWGLRHG